MTVEQLSAIVTKMVPGAQRGTSKQFPEFIVTPDQVRNLAQGLKEHPETKMDYLFCLTAIDRKDGFHIVYHLTSSSESNTAVLRTVLTDKVNPVVPTVSDIWRAAEFYERGVFDLFGIRFENHPDLRRIFLEDDWVGHPLRKDYKDSFTLDR